MIIHLKKSLSIALILVGLSLSTFVQAQDYKAKNDGWLVKIEEAYEASQKTGKPILANFTGSDWCGWCKRLDKSVFHHQEFKDWATANVILLELDFPKRFPIPDEIKRQNYGLKNAFQVTGFPTIWLFDLSKDAEGKFNVNALGKTGYTATVKEFTGNMELMLARRTE